MSTQSSKGISSSGGLAQVADERAPLRPSSSTERKGLLKSSGLLTAARDPAREKRGLKLALYVCASTFTAAANAVGFKKMLNAYKSDDGVHNLELFANQFNIALYVLLAGMIVVQRRIKYGAHWWDKQDLPFSVLCIMGLLDAVGSILSTLGGAYTAGAVQTLLNQVIIPVTLALSWLLLGQRFTWSQSLGAVIISVGAVIAVLPSFLKKANSNPTTVTGVIVFLASIIPGALSNVYKEWGFAQYHVDLYYLTTYVSTIQVLFGFAFLPALRFPAFGGVPMREVPQQMTLGFQCFLGQDPQPGYDCEDGFQTMIGYVFVNFAFNVLQLLITKYGGATLLVISAALALPVTNFAFKMRIVMGKDTEPFNLYDVAALLVVLTGFVIYSAVDDFLDRSRQRRRLPIQFAAGSVMYLRERSNSDPSTPGYTPLRFEPPRRRGSIDMQLNRTPSFQKQVKRSSSMSSPPSSMASQAIDIRAERREKGVHEPVTGSLRPGALVSHAEVEEQMTNSL